MENVKLKIKVFSSKMIEIVGVAHTIIFNFQFSIFNYAAHAALLSDYLQQGGECMKREEKKEERQPNTWEVTDPKPPVIQSGHMENRVSNREVM